MRCNLKKNLSGSSGKWRHLAQFVKKIQKLFTVTNFLYFHFPSDSNGIWTYNHLVPKRRLNQLAKLVILAKWLSACLWTNRLWVRILLLSLKLQISPLFWARGSLTLGNYRVQTHSETRTWHDNNIQFNFLLNWLALEVKDSKVIYILCTSLTLKLPLQPPKNKNL